MSKRDEKRMQKINDCAPRATRLNVDINPINRLHNWKDCEHKFNLFNYTCRNIPTKRPIEIYNRHDLICTNREKTGCSLHFFFSGKIKHERTFFRTYFVLFTVNRIKLNQFKYLVVVFCSNIHRCNAKFNLSNQKNVYFWIEFSNDNLVFEWIFMAIIVLCSSCFTVFSHKIVINFAQKCKILWKFNFWNKIKIIIDYVINPQLIYWNYTWINKSTGIERNV